jgi:hypothetical protein
MSKQSQPSAAPNTSQSAAAAPSPAPRRARRVLGLPALVAVPLAALAAAGCGSAQPEQAIAPKVVDVALTAPARGTVTSASEVTVRGTVSPADAVVLVQGRPASVGNGVFVATATVHRGRTRIDVIASAQGATPTATSVAVTRPKARRRTRPQPAVAPSTVLRTTVVPVAVSTPSAGASCGDGLVVGPNTTCPFAVNVRAAYAAHGAGTVVAYSPVTGADYAMICSAGATVVCTGGNHAAVYFDGPASTGTVTAPASAPSFASGATASCGDGLAVGPNTSCPFAENVRAAYDRRGPGAVAVYSPVTRRTYVMTCSRGASVVCTGGDHASVYFD